MAFVGADTGQLRELADLMAKSANELTGDLVPTVSGRLASSPWQGPDRQQFDHRWNSQLVHQIRNAATALDEAAKVARKNADDQDRTSNSDGSFLSGGSGRVGRVPAADGGRGKSKSTKANPEGFTEPRGGKYGLDRDLMDLSFAAYKSGDADHGDYIPAGWEHVSDDELKELGINSKAFEKLVSGFSATLYRDVDGRYALAFRGTNELQDWASNAGNSLLFSQQAAEAAQLTDHIKQRLEANGVKADQLSLTGHSLGGGIASIASLTSGVRAATFNASGASDMTKTLSVARRYVQHGEFVSFEGEKGKITAYTASGDPLTRIQDYSKLPSAYGDRVPLKTRSGSAQDYVVTGLIGQAGFDHGKTPLQGAYDKIALEAEEYYY